MENSNNKMLTGYCDRISVKPGESLQFMLSAEQIDHANVQIVRLIHGDEGSQGPGFIEEEIDASCNGKVDVVTQFTQAGSFVAVPGLKDVDIISSDFSVHAYVLPTLAANGKRQAIVSQWDETSQQGFSLEIDEQGFVSLCMGNGKQKSVVRMAEPIQNRVWYSLAAVYAAKDNKLTVHQTAVVNSTNSLLSPIAVDRRPQQSTETVVANPSSSGTEVLLAGYYRTQSDGTAIVEGLYNGKIDRPGILGRSLSVSEIECLSSGVAPSQDGVIAYWDTSAGYTESGIGDEVIDTGLGQYHGQGYNRPVRAATGFNWEGKVDCFRLNPQQFGGIHFHEDAMIDCRWAPTFSWTIPDALKSGVYAARLTEGDAEDYITFFVRPTTPTADVCMLMPTASYLAYANEHFVLHGPAVEAITAHTLILSDRDYLLGSHPEWGLSSYDHHSDGAGVCYSSYKRPIMGMRPKHRMAATGVTWQFPADLSIVYWLESQGIEYDIQTDEDLHREGLDLLKPYKLVIKGTHSEYYSSEMLDATEQYIDAGGNVVYTGANGFYWAVAFRADEPECMEIRKLDVGSRAWQAEPGEFYMATNGEKGGVWRARARIPQKVFGVGFTSEGMDECKPYRRMPDSYESEVSWLFDNVENEVFGDYGLALNGAAGLEIDRYDLSLGTPPNTWLLASSEGHSDNYPHVSEEIGFNYPGLGGTQNPQIRADLTYFEGVNGGSVLSTGSIAWGQSLPIDEGNNDVSRITANYIARKCS